MWAFSGNSVYSLLSFQQVLYDCHAEFDHVVQHSQGQQSDANVQ